jgi:hypothetical protein
MPNTIYHLHIQKLRTGKHRVVVVAENGKLVLAGEPLNRKIDANRIRDHIFNVSLDGFIIGPNLGPRHKFVKNSGPKKKK